MFTKSNLLFEAALEYRLPYIWFPISQQVCHNWPINIVFIMQVNQWLTWLETAEEEESEDDDY